MPKITANKIESSSILDFFKRADIGSPQTIEIIGDEIISRAYPKSKAFIKIETFKLPVGTNKTGERLKMPMLSLGKMISALSLLKGEISMDFEVLNSIIDKTTIHSGKTKLAIHSGDLGLVLPPLPDDVWGKLSDTSEATIEFDLALTDIAHIYKLNVIETGTSSKQIQRAGAFKISNKEVFFSNPTGDGEKDVWSHQIDTIALNKENDGEWLFNIKNLNYFKDDKCKAYFKDAKDRDGVKILVLKGETSNMLLMLNRQ